jgi:hypothetical protein
MIFFLCKTNVQDAHEGFDCASLKQTLFIHAFCSKRNQRDLHKNSEQNDNVSTREHRVFHLLVDKIRAKHERQRKRHSATKTTVSLQYANKR